MTIAHLLVRLSAETAEFHAEMEKAARRIESTGRRIAKIGRENCGVTGIQPFASLVYSPRMCWVCCWLRLES